MKRDEEPGVPKRQKSDDSDSLENLSAIDEKDIPRRIKEMMKMHLEYEEVRNTKFVSKMLFDDPFFYVHLPAHNRDENLKLPEPPKMQPNMEMAFSEIDSPTHFWFHTVENFESINQLHINIDAAYSKLKDNDLKIAPENIKMGLIVLCKHVGLDKWFRARIQRKAKYNATVFFIDYGTTELTTFDNIKYLMNEFMEYPEFCHRGRLYGVMPATSEGFLNQDREFLLREYTNVTLKAEVKYFCERQKTYELQIQYIDSGKDMAKRLFVRNICKPIPEELLKDRSRMLPYFYLMPTHAALTKEYPFGTFPNFETMYKLESQGYYFGTLINSNYFMNSKKITIEMKEMLNKISSFKVVKERYSQQ